MKAQVNTFEAARELNNRVMLITLLLIGIALIIASGRIFFEKDFSNAVRSYEVINPNKGFSSIGFVIVKKSDDSREQSSFQTIESKEACCSKKINHDLDVEHLKSYMNANRMLVFRQTMAAFADVEEPELLMTEVREIVNTQYEQLKNYDKMEIEEALDIEAWMTNEENWSVKANIPELFAVVDTEEALELEDWMTNEENWNVKANIPELFAELEAEETLELEEWMTNEEYWNVEANIPELFAEVETEETLEVEDWMTDTEYWNVKYTLPATFTNVEEKLALAAEYYIFSTIW